MVLAAAVDLFAEQYDLILFAFSPAPGLLTVSALVAAREVLVPVAMGPMEIDGIVKLLLTVELAARRLDPGLADRGSTWPSRSNHGNGSPGLLEVLAAKFGDLASPRSATP